MFVQYTSLIIPTRNRNEYLENILRQIKKLHLKFYEILVIDSSDNLIKSSIIKICESYKVRLYHSLPSTSEQRNIGLKKIGKKAKFVMLLDDDIVFFKNSFKEMNFAIQKYDKFCGFGFNLITKPRKTSFLERIKNHKFAEHLNLYSPKPGVITKSGWQTKIMNLKKDTKVDWVYTAASIFKLNLIKNIRFDTSFGIYSYLEDLDFCLQLHKKKLLIVHKAKFLHPNEIERNNFYFGITEIFNRFIIVKKNKLNLTSFFCGAFIRFLISFVGFLKGNFSFFFRACGNILGIFKSLLNLIKF